MKFRKLLKKLVLKFPGFVKSYRYWRDARRLKELPRMTSLGFYFLGNKVMEAGSFELNETRLVKGLLPQVDLVVNVGANIGYYTCLSLREGKRVMAFEPIELNLQYLLRNIRANGWDNLVEVFPVALSNCVGSIEIYGGGTGASLLPGWAGGSVHDSTLVPCNTLDNVLAGRLDGEKVLFIVDIEGAEQMMLEGATGVLRLGSKALWLVEICVSEHQPEGVAINPNLITTFELFWDAGYRSYRVGDDGLIEVIRERVDRVIETGVDDLGTHNFLFVAGDFAL